MGCPQRLALLVAGKCNVCPKAYHLAWVGTPGVPRAEWHCPQHYCGQFIAGEVHVRI